MSDTDYAELLRGAMTVGYLKQLLAKYPDDMPVLTRKNDDVSSPMCCDGEVMYVPESTWQGEIYVTPEEYERDRDQHDEYSEPPKDAIRSLHFCHTY